MINICVCFALWHLYPSTKDIVRLKLSDYKSQNSIGELDLSAIQTPLITLSCYRFFLGNLYYGSALLELPSSQQQYFFLEVC